MRIPVDLGLSMIYTVEIVDFWNNLRWWYRIWLYIIDTPQPEDDGNMIHASLTRIDHGYAL